MEGTGLPTAAQLRLRISLTSSGICAMGGVLLVVYLLPVIHFSGEQLFFTTALILSYTLPLAYVSFLVQSRWMAGTLSYLDRFQSGAEPGEEATCEAFAHVLGLPGRYFLYNLACFVVGAVFVASVLVIRYAGFGPMIGLMMAVSAVSAGLVTQLFIFTLLKMILEPVRSHLATRISDPDRRRALVKPVSMARQLFIALTGVALSTAVYTMVLAEGRGQRNLESFVVAGQAALLDQIARDVTAGQEPATRLADASLSHGSLGYSFALLDSSGSQVVSGPRDLLTAEEFVHLRELGQDGGNSLDFDSPSSFSWKRMEGSGEIAVAVVAENVLQSGLSQSAGVIFLVMVGVVLVAILIAFSLARDLSRSIQSMREQIRRISKGDLRKGPLFESEHELGELSRAVDGMRRSLRDTVGWILEGAHGVEGASQEIAAVSGTAVNDSQAQLGEVEHVKTAVDLVNNKLVDIATSTLGLEASIGASSSSVASLQTGGDDLHASARALSEQAGQASGSIQQVIGSVRQILSNTERLAAEVDEASASLGQMTGQVRGVESSANEAADLSDQVVAVADRGRERVEETIRGMEDIRAATTSAEQGVRRFLERVREIASIVDVIDDVAEETNLLALNAAIIAAQAGDQGRAFAVVADEVRDLADRVTSSTTEISSLIRGLQRESAAAASSIRASFENVERGVELSAEAGASLEEITEGARRSGDRVQEIVATVKESAAVSRHVEELMEHVHQGTGAILSAAGTQRAETERLLAGVVTVDETADQVRATAEEQAGSTDRIAEGVHEARATMSGVHAALEDQRDACARVTGFLEVLHERTNASERAARTSAAAIHALYERFEELRDQVERRFQI